MVSQELKRAFKTFQVDDHFTNALDGSMQYCQYLTQSLLWGWPNYDGPMRRTDEVSIFFYFDTNSQILENI